MGCTWPPRRPRDEKTWTSLVLTRDGNHTVVWSRSFRLSDSMPSASVESVRFSPTVGWIAIPAERYPFFRPTGSSPVSATGGRAGVWVAAAAPISAASRGFPTARAWSTAPTTGSTVALSADLQPADGRTRRHRRSPVTFGDPLLPTARLSPRARWWLRGRGPSRLTCGAYRRSAPPARTARNAVRITHQTSVVQAPSVSTRWERDRLSLG